MKGSSKLIMGATLVMVLSLTMVLGLVLVLLAELYCSLLLRRRQLRATTAASTTAAAIATATTQPDGESVEAPPLGSFYSQGVLRAPRSFLFPAVSGKDDLVDVEKQQHSQQHQVVQSLMQTPNYAHHKAEIAPTSPPSAVTSPQPKVQFQAGSTSNSSGGDFGEQLVYISNPIYDNGAGRPSRGDGDTPFETPDTSPSRLETDSSSGDDDEDGGQSSAITPPLTPMKKLPAVGSSISLRDARPLGTSGSDSNSNNGLSSSSSGSPSTSPSW